MGKIKRYYRIVFERVKELDQMLKEQTIGTKEHKYIESLIEINKIMMLALDGASRGYDIRLTKKYEPEMVYSQYTYMPMAVS